MVYTFNTSTLEEEADGFKVREYREFQARQENRTIKPRRNDFITAHCSPLRLRDYGGPSDSRASLSWVCLSPAREDSSLVGMVRVGRKGAPSSPFSGVMTLAACLLHQVIFVDLLSLRGLKVPLWHA